MSFSSTFALHLIFQICPQKHKKSRTRWVLDFLRRVDKKDATIQNSKFHKIIQYFFDVFYFFFRES